MQNIIDHTKFVGSFLVANALESKFVQAELNALITEKQPEFLDKLLGGLLHEAFATWYVTNPRNATYNDLLNGKAFLDTSWMPMHTIKWVGIAKPLTAYVYYWYLRNNATQTVSAGEVKAESANARPQSSIRKQVTTWNLMVDQLRDYIRFMNTTYGAESLWTDYWIPGSYDYGQGYSYYSRRLWRPDIFYKINVLNT